MKTQLPKKIEDFHNYQQARSNCFRSFDKKYEYTKDIDKSLEKALDTAKVNENVLKLDSKHYKGLKGEIIFYGRTCQSLDLDVLMDSKKIPADFHSPLPGTFIVVYETTNGSNMSDIIQMAMTEMNNISKMSGMNIMSN